MNQERKGVPTVGNSVTDLFSSATSRVNNNPNELRPGHIISYTEHLLDAYFCTVVMANGRAAPQSPRRSDLDSVVNDATG